MSQQPVGVLVTRPAHQSGPLIKQIEQLGATAIAFPSIEIKEIKPDLSGFDLNLYHNIIFISANAVKHGAKYLKNSLISSNITIFAIGKTTAQQLLSVGVNHVIQPLSGFNTESLLKHELLASKTIDQQRVLIVRGEGGRELLADSLRERGAQVDYLEVYRRERPNADITPLLARWSAGEITIVTVTSNESLKNLYDMLNAQGRELLLNTALITPSERCTELAKQLGFRNLILQATSASDDDIINQIKLWMANTP